MNGHDLCRLTASRTAGQVVEEEGQAPIHVGIYPQRVGLKPLSLPWPFYPRARARGQGWEWLATIFAALRHPEQRDRSWIQSKHIFSRGVLTLHEQRPNAISQNLDSPDLVNKEPSADLG